MAWDERSRWELREAMMGTFGPGPTEALISALPPTDWSEFATKRDVENLGIELRAEMNALDHRLTSQMVELRGEVRNDLRDQLTTHLRWMVTLSFALTIAVFTGGLAL